MTSPWPPLVQALDLRASYGRDPVLKGVSFDLDVGDQLAVVGRNGCGKSTLLRVLAGLLAPQAGSVRWSGEPMPQGPAALGRIGVCFQEEARSKLRVAELVDLGLDAGRWRPRERERLVADQLSRLELESVANQACEALSGGVWRRVLLARALVAEPRLLLLDEPTNHLDPVQRGRFFELLRELRGRCATIVATHDFECMVSCESVLGLAEGRACFRGSVQALLHGSGLSDIFGRQFRVVEDPLDGSAVFRTEPRG